MVDFGGKKGDGDKFLGKEVEFYKLIFEYLNAIRIASIMGDSERFISLVNTLDNTFPYKDDEFKMAIKKAQEKLDGKLHGARDKFGKADDGANTQAFLEFSYVKYDELVKLFKRKKVFPQEAEEEWM